jgi:hypothetical protein
MAIPFHSSVRLKLGAGQQIKNKDGDVIGINVSAKTIKNKVAPPFRSVNFEIHFGKGIKEHEQTFDLLRKHGEASIDGNNICVSGAGAWKTLLVVNEDTGEIIAEKKFHKGDFDEIWKSSDYGHFVDLLLEDALVRKMETEDPDVDIESYEEVRSIAESMSL